MKGWIVYAIASMVFAGCTSVIAKLGLTGISGDLGLAVRTVFVFVFVMGTAACTVPRGEWVALTASNAWWLGLSAARRPRFAQLAFLVIAAFLLTNKVWSPQYSLWLVPLAVLALPRWRLLLAWMVVDALLWAPRMYYYLTPANKGLPPDWFLGAAVLRDAVVVLLMVLVVRTIIQPETDPVRELDVEDDPDWPAPARVTGPATAAHRRPTRVPVQPEP